jgi:cellulose synthase (UDP-forming)
LNFQDHRGHCALVAQIVGAHGRTQHLAFSPLDLDQEKYVLRLAFSLSEAWSAWHRVRPPDRPLRSGFEILVLAVRGLTLVVVGLVVHVPARADTKSRRSNRRTAVIGLLALGFGLHPTRADAQRRTTFEDTIQLGAISGSGNGIALHGPQAVENVFFDLPVTKIVTSAALELRYDSSGTGRDSILELWLNDTRVAELSVVPGFDMRSDVSLPTDLFTTDNSLSFRSKSTCVGCAAGQPLSIAIRPSTTLRIRGSRLPLGNDLSLLPIPFIDPTGQRVSVVPVAFSDEPGTAALEAAGIIASWFGVFSDVRGVRFPVTVGELPVGNAVVFARRGSPLAAGQTLSRLLARLPRAIGSAPAPLSCLRVCRSLLRHPDPDMTPHDGSEPIGPRRSARTRVPII